MDDSLLWGSSLLWLGSSLLLDGRQAAVAGRHVGCSMRVVDHLPPALALAPPCLQAGGKATTGTSRTMEIMPTSIHGRQAARC